MQKCATNDSLSIGYDCIRMSKRIGAMFINYLVGKRGLFDTSRLRHRDTRLVQRRNLLYQNNNSVTNLTHHVFMSPRCTCQVGLSNRSHVPIIGITVAPTSKEREREREFPLTIAASLYVNWERASKSWVVLSQ